MKCIFCNNTDSKVVDSRYLKDTSIRRRRECLRCGKRFTTYETVETNPIVVTNENNMREPFKIEKLLESIQYAIYCKDVALSAEQIAENVEKRLLKLEQQEITTKQIVEIALDELMVVSSIAYLVYYTQHTNCNSFNDIRMLINR